MDLFRLSLLCIIVGWFGWTLVISLPIYYATRRDIWVRNPVAFLLSWPFTLRHDEHWEVLWFNHVVSTDKDNGGWPADDQVPIVLYLFLTVASGITKIGIGLAVVAIWQFEPLLLIPLGLYLAFLLFVRGIWPTVGPHLGNKK